MKRILFVIAFAIQVVISFSQDKTDVYLWPIKDAKPGSDMISVPQSYIDGEHNFSDLFIGAKEGAEVVAPTDGTVNDVGASYLTSFTYMNGSNCKDNSINDQIKDLAKVLGKSADPKYVTGKISIAVPGGKVIYISGITSDRIFKTGQKISRGEVLGKVAYSYKKIKEPSVCLSISRYGKPNDPMSPFGIKTTFIPAAEIKPITSLTKEQAKEDFTVYMDVLKEVYPGLYNVITPEDLDKYISKTLARIDANNGDWDFVSYRMLIRGAIARIHDSHIYIHSPIWEKGGAMPDYQPRVFIGWIADTLICTNATKEYANLIGKQVVSMNGMAADSMKRIIMDNVTDYDAGVAQYKDYMLATTGFGALFRRSLPKKPTFDMTLEFADGQTVDVKGQSTKNGMPKYVNDWLKFLNVNRYREMYSMKTINDSTAYIGLFSFELNETQVEEIGKFIDSMSSKPYLIIDVRNNSGGHIEVLEKLYSYIAGDDPAVLAGYKRVNKIGGFETLKYSFNYSPETQMFSDSCKTVEGKPGFYDFTMSGNCIRPDSLINYKGRVYVLANENSVSAATVFPALLVRNHRGVVVGRETRTAYHFMNAEKFADIRLPNSTITITVPLAELCFDTVVNARVPYGRGLIPDYMVPVTMDELSFKNGDAILNHALCLIADGKYISAENPFDTPMEVAESVEDTEMCWGWYFLIGGVVVVVGAVYLFVHRNKKGCK